MDWAGERGQSWGAHLDPLEAMLTPVNPPLLDALELGQAHRVADLACGGGGSTAALVQAAPPGSVVHGYDISPSLLELARTRVGPPAEFFVANLETAPEPEEKYERLVSRFGTMFFSDPPAAFRNIARWLKPGGKFAFAVWGAPAENRWASVVREAVASVVTVPDTPPDSPGPFRYGEIAPYLELLKSAGFINVHPQMWRGALRPAGGVSPEEAASFALSAFSSFAALLEGAGPKAGPAAHEALRTALSAYVEDGEVALPAAVHLVTGSLASRA